MIFDQNPQSWVEWTAASVSLSQTKGNDINLIDRFQMQNDTENEIGRSLFPFIYKCNRFIKTTIPKDSCTRQQRFDKLQLIH